MTSRKTWLARMWWVLGVLGPWILLWLLMGLRILPGIRSTPNPFLREFTLTDIMLKAVVEWVFSALVIHVLMGLVLAFLAQVAVSLGAPKSEVLDGRGGALLAGAGILWFHAALYWSVPVAMGTVPLLRSLPMGLSLLLLATGGAALLYLQIRRSPGRFRVPRTILGLLLLSLPTLVPHDSFRRLRPQPERLDPAAPRVLLAGLDAMRKDVFEEIMPAWKAPGGVNTLTPAPATRKLWNLTMGADPAAFDRSTVIPARWELQQPEHLRLLALAKARGVRTAFLINDPLTLSFGLQPHLFTHVYEPDGGWKYWFTLGYGSAWPVYSWAQNYLSPIETSNVWSDAEAYWRDVDRALEGHQWVSSHICDLHTPITLRRRELRDWRGWAWLLERASAYRSSSVPDELLRRPERQTWRGDALLHYKVRMRSVLKGVEPHLAAWTARYPALNGVVFSDHGETHLSVGLPNGLKTHLAGMHGFWADVESLRVPLHPFGRTQHALGPEDVWSVLSLRDSIAVWLKDPAAPLVLRGWREGLLAQFIGVQAAFSIPKSEQHQELHKDGIRSEELMSYINLLPGGIWFLDPPEAKATDQARAMERLLCRAMAQGPRLIVFNPVVGGQWERVEYSGYKELGRTRVDDASFRREMAAFPGTQRTRALVE